MNSKIIRLIEIYELTDMDEQLVNYWTREDDKHYSLRELADYFNKKLLRAAMDGAGILKDRDIDTLLGGLIDSSAVQTAERISAQLSK